MVSRGKQAFRKSGSLQISDYKTGSQEAAGTKLFHTEESINLFQPANTGQNRCLACQAGYLFDAMPHPVAKINVEYPVLKNGLNSLYKNLDIAFDQFRPAFPDTLQTALTFSEPDQPSGSAFSRWEKTISLAYLK